jgi:multiple sugar transport system substrate-binding protein
MGSDAPLSDIADENKKSFTTVVRPIPQFDPDNPKMISQGPSVCVFNKEDPQEVLASWLFAQFLLTNDIQVAYSKTEGYIPVTKKAQDSEEYKEYLSLAGSDDDHYTVKMDATKLLLKNTSNTFTTPVFNGSVSLRDAAGALIENVAKAKRRGTDVDEAFIQKTYDDVRSLYKLDAHIQGAGTKEVSGELPFASKILISVLALAWIVIGSVLIYNAYMKRRERL